MLHWPCSQCSLLYVLASHTSVVRGLEFSPDAKFLFR
jgi:hypothetical protein